MLEEIEKQIYLEMDKNNKLFKYKEKKYFIGSKYKKDKNNQDYINSIISQIKIQMETDNIVIMQDLGDVYPALYELFNQSFSYFGGKKFARLGLSKSLSLSLVNDNFKVIVMIDKNKILEEEPPFLNRFEKHILSFSSLLTDDLIKLSDEIYNTLQEINTLKIENYDIGKKFKNHFRFINQEEIKGLVYMAIKELNDIDDIISSNKIEDLAKRNEKIIEYVLSKISPCFTE